LKIRRPHDYQPTGAESVAGLAAAANGAAALAGLITGKINSGILRTLLTLPCRSETSF
jgi:hypothetical protein